MIDSVWILKSFRYVNNGVILCNLNLEKNVNEIGFGGDGLQGSYDAVKRIFENGYVTSSEDVDYELEVEIINWKNNETISYRLEWNWADGIVEEIIRQDQDLVCSRSKRDDDDIPVIGPKWQEDEATEELVWDWYRLLSSDKTQAPQIYLAGLTKQGKIMKDFCKYDFIVINLTSNDLTKIKGVSGILAMYRSKYPFCLMGLNDDKIIYDQLNKLLPKLGFYDIVIDSFGAITQRGIKFDLCEMGSGLLNLMYLLPILENIRINKGKTVYIPLINLSLHPITYGAFKYLELDENINEGNRIIYFDSNSALDSYIW